MQVELTIDDKLDQLLTLRLKAWEHGFVFALRGHPCPSAAQLAKLDQIYNNRFSNGNDNLNSNTTHENRSASPR